MPCYYYSPSLTIYLLKGCGETLGSYGLALALCGDVACSEATVDQEVGAVDERRVVGCDCHQCYSEF